MKVIEIQDYIFVYPDDKTADSALKHLSNGREMSTMPMLISDFAFKIVRKQFGDGGNRTFYVMVKDRSNLFELDVELPKIDKDMALDMIKNGYYFHLNGDKSE